MKSLKAFLELLKWIIALLLFILGLLVLAESLTEEMKGLEDQKQPELETPKKN